MLRIRCDGRLGIKGSANFAPQHDPGWLDPGKQANRTLKLQTQLRRQRIIGINRNGFFENMPPVSPGVSLDFNLSACTGLDGIRPIGCGAATTRTNVQYLKWCGALIFNHVGMGDDLTFENLIESEFLFDRHDVGSTDRTLTNGLISGHCSANADCRYRGDNQ